MTNFNIQIQYYKHAVVKKFRILVILAYFSQEYDYDYGEEEEEGFPMNEK